MLAATFVHETSRAKDPDLHMHVLIANVTIDPERNEALAMSYGEMLEMRKTLGPPDPQQPGAPVERIGLYRGSGGTWFPATRNPGSN